MGSTYRIHLVFTPHKTAPVLGMEVPIPSRYQYGHVHTMLQNDNEFLELNFSYRKVSYNSSKSGLNRLFEIAMKKGYVSRNTEYLGELLSVDIVACSFNLLEQQYADLEQYYYMQSGRVVPYDRHTKNCVYWAAQDLKAASIETPEIKWLTAGMFFSQMNESPLSLGNKLCQESNAPEVRVIERTVPLHP